MKRLLTRDINLHGLWDFLPTASLILSVFIIAIWLNPGVSPLVPGLAALVSAAFLIWLGRAMRDQSANEADSKSLVSPNSQNEKGEAEASPIKPLR